MYEKYKTYFDDKFIDYDEKWLKRYFNFMEKFKDIESDVKESHHILPKKLFKEYKSFSKHKWNKVNLSARVHFICHYMLSKAINDMWQSTAFISETRRLKSSLYESAKRQANLETSIRQTGDSNVAKRPEVREKISKSHIGKKLTDEHKEKIRTTTRKNNFKHTEEAKKRISDAQKGRTLSEEHKEKLRGPREHTRGVERTKEYREKISASKKGVKQKIIRCPHCGKEGGNDAMKRYHFDNCKENPNRNVVDNRSHKKKREYTPVTCPHCNISGYIPTLKRWHFDNCKRK